MAPRIEENSMKKLMLIAVLLLSIPVVAKKRPLAPPFDVSITAVYDGGTITGTATFVDSGSTHPDLTNWEIQIGSDRHFFNHGIFNANSLCGSGSSNTRLLGASNQYIAYNICGFNSAPDNTGELTLIFDKNFLGGAQQLVAIIPTANTRDGLQTFRSGFDPGGGDLYRHILSGTITNTTLPALMSCSAGAR